MKRDFFDFDSDYYKPLWVRILILVVCFGWGFIELGSGNIGWAVIFLAAGGYCLWGFFLRNSDDE